MASEICLILHRKSANEPAIKEAVKHVRSKGIDLRVRIPWNKKAKPRVVKEAIARGAKRVIAGGGDGTINAVVNALVGKYVVGICGGFVKAEFSSRMQPANSAAGRNCLQTCTGFLERWD